MTAREATALLQALPEDQQDAPLVMWHAGLYQSLLGFRVIYPGEHGNRGVWLQAVPWTTPEMKATTPPQAPAAPKK